MARNRKQKKNSKNHKGATAKSIPVRINKPKYPIFTLRLKKWITVILLGLLAIVLSLSFFGKAGGGGQYLTSQLQRFIGRTVFFVPLLLILAIILFWKPQKKRVLTPVLLGMAVLLIGISGALTILTGSDEPRSSAGGYLGYLASWFLLKYFGVTVAFVVFFALMLIGVLILWEFIPKRARKFPLSAKSSAVQPFKTVKEEEELQKAKLKFELKPIDVFPKKKEPSSKQEIAQDEFKKDIELPKEAEDDYKRPALELLDTSEEKPASGDINYNGLVIKKNLLNFGIEVEMSEVNVGPTVTQYTLKPAEGVKLAKITALNNDLALALAAHPIRIEAPIPGRPLVGIEVPNKVRAKVKLGNLLSLPQYQKSALLSFALGKDVMGSPMYLDLGTMPHLLVAGATGTGKTICLNSIIMSLIFRNSPKFLRLILIDPKRVEFTVYGSLPHLLTPVILNAQKAVNVLNWLIGEMERRFDVLQEFGARDIASYNRALGEKPKKKEEGFSVMPYIVLIIDELADLMAAKGREVEAAIVRLSQLSRAVGIHLVVATQRPSVEVITGLIKANITSRVAFQVASQVDSRTILDTAGSEKLLGRGDMLFISAEFSKPKRIQGSFVSTPEIKKVVKFIEKENAPQEKETIEDNARSENNLEKEINLDDSSLEEPLYSEAKEIVVTYGKASASLLQRRLRIGYARAARILDILEENGVIGQADGAKPREVFINKEGNKDGFHDASDVEFK